MSSLAHADSFVALSSDSGIMVNAWCFIVHSNQGPCKLLISEDSRFRERDCVSSSSSICHQRKFHLNISEHVVVARSARCTLDDELDSVRLS